MSRTTSKTAIVTGASRGLGLALSRALGERGWRLVIDARGSEQLERARLELSELTEVTALPGDVADEWHRTALVEEAGARIDLLVNNASALGPSPLPPVADLPLDRYEQVLRVNALAPLGLTQRVLARMPTGGRILNVTSDAAGPEFDLLVNNASVLGPSPLPPLADYPLDALEEVHRVNTVAPLALVQLALPLMPPGARIVNVTSDAAVEAYEGWGGYGSSKAALEQLTRVLAAEQPELRVYAIDPGDMRTRMHQDAFPGEDISDRPAPEESVPGLLALIEGDLPSGRYAARELAAAAAG